MMQRLQRALSPLWNNIGFVCAAAALVFCVIHAFDPPRLNWGDSGSDYNVMTSGRNFVKYGFLRLHLTPYLLDPSSIVTQPDRVYIYTHYPQLPDLMNGLLRKLFGLTELVQFRFFALLVSFGSLFFIYRLALAYWDRMTAQVALALWVWNPMWIQHADYLHHVPYGAFFGFGSLYFLHRYLRDTRTRWLLASGAFLWLTYLSSYDWWFFAPILLFAATVGHYGRNVRPAARTLAVLVAFAVAAVAAKLGTNIWALGGIQPFLADLRFQFAERASDAVVNTNYQAAIWVTLVGRVERFFTLLLFPIALFWVLFPFLRRRVPGLRTPGANPVILLVAALPFLMLFVEIWISQYYPAVLLIPFYAVGAAAIVSLLWWHVHHAAARPVAVLLTVLLLASSADEDLAFPPAFFPDDIARRMAAQIDSVSAPDQTLIINHIFDSAYRFYFRRKVLNVVLMPPAAVDGAFRNLANPRLHPETATDQGAVFVQHKHVVDELYDKGYYYIFANQRLWDAWGNPRAYRRFIDSLMTDRDSTLMARVGKLGHRLYDDEFYSIWRIDPPAAIRDSVAPSKPAPR
jgi:hypothetical protein